MSVTNLNGYTWTGNDKLTPPLPLSESPDLHISCTHNDISYNNFNFFRVDDWPSDWTEIWLNGDYSADMIYSDDGAGWTSSNHSVTFGDGVDASNTDFISWLEENGTLKKDFCIDKIKLDDVIYNIKDTVAREAINNLPKPMIFIGTLGEGYGTTSELPPASEDTAGWTYKVVVAGRYKGYTAKVGDMFICGEPEMPEVYEWVYVPSADEEFNDTWRGIKVNGNNFLGSSITSGNIDFVAGNNITLDTSSANKSITINSNDVIKNGTGLNSIVQKARPGSEGSDANNYASEEGAVALGRYNNSNGICSVALNYDNEVTGNYSFAANNNNSVSADAAAAFGHLVSVSGESGFGAGNSNTITGACGTSFGYNNEVHGEYGNAVGGHNKVYGQGGFAGGMYSESGVEDTTGCKASFVYGWGLQSNNNYQTIFGVYNNPSLTDVFEIGYGTEAARNNVFAVNRDGKVTVKATQGNSPTLQLGNTTLTDSDVTSLKAVPSQLDNKIDKLSYSGAGETWLVGFDEFGEYATQTEIDLDPTNRYAVPTSYAVAEYAERKTYIETKDINNDYANLAGGKITIASNSVTSFACDEEEFAIGDTSSIIFTTNSTVGTIEMPYNVKWSVAAPIFEPNTTYWLTFTKLTNTLTVGVWSVLV